MYAVGANDPNVGNDRRNQLLQTLAAQLQQRAAQQQGQVAAPAAGFLGFMKKKQQLMPSTPTRAAGAGRATAGTALTNPNNIPGATMSQLGPGGMAHGNGYGSSAPGMPAPMPGAVHGHTGPGGMSSPIPGGAMPPAGGSSGGAPIGGFSPGAPVVQTGTGSDGTPLVQTQGSIGHTDVVPGPQGQFIPLGNGMFLDPATGAVHGMPGGVLGGAVRGLGR